MRAHACFKQLRGFNTEPEGARGRAVECVRGKYIEEDLQQQTKTQVKYKISDLINLAVS